MKAIKSESAPAALGSYSQAVEQGNMLWVSMQIGINSGNGELQTGFSAQMEQVMENLSAVMKAGGYDWGNVVKVSIYLADLGDFSEMNGIYARYLQAPYPAREVVGVSSLPRGARVGVSLTAMK
jgi:2-iminobutanoate/2-iminopropanoate deaminase